MVMASDPSNTSKYAGRLGGLAALCCQNCQSRTGPVLSDLQDGNVRLLLSDHLVLAVAAFYTDDAVFLPPSHEVIKGPAGVEKFYLRMA
jgi:hypothetical protein